VGLFLLRSKILLALSIYLLATALFMGVVVDSLEDDERMPPISLLVTSLLWPVETLLMFWDMLNDKDPDN
tara:strand:- start:69 stop:278 length:210 start_codon:yes stop_codon:yes gene_type:complete